ncbi:MAG: porin family protein [Candidatus Eisenbacteria bacterium]
MKNMRTILIAVAALSLLAFGGTIAAAQDLNDWQSTGMAEVSLMGGVQALNENDTSIYDNILNVPVTATLGYRLSPIFALEGDFTWVIPVQQSVELQPGVKTDRKSPDVLLYQANLRADLPLERSPVKPYLAAGLGGATFLSNTDANRLPRLQDSQTAFAINFGAGLNARLSGPWGVRADFREFVAFPPNDAEGLSVDGKADDVWMERASLGLSYRF